MNKSSADDLMVMVSWMYYEDDLTQEEIAKQLKMSRVSVHRILRAALQKGIVKIQIARPRPLQLELSLKLKERFGLSDAIIVPKSDDPFTSVGRAAAEYLEEAINTYKRVGVGWSSTMSSITPYLPRYSVPVDCQVNELAGNMLHQQNPYTISPYLVQAFGVKLETLPVPAIVQNEIVRKTLLDETAVKAALENAKQVEIAFVGLGESASTNTMIQTGYLTLDEMNEITKRGGVGEILLRFFDAQGRHIDSPLDSRVITLDWESLKRIPKVILIAIGAKKIEAILGALSTGIIHCWITDTETVQEVLRTSK
jgi:DNA-binding transcriptional regulator LsrR (DeoR family)